MKISTSSSVKLVVLNLMNQILMNQSRVLKNPSEINGCHLMYVYMVLCNFYFYIYLYIFWIYITYYKRHWSQYCQDRVDHYSEYVLFISFSLKICNLYLHKNYFHSTRNIIVQYHAFCVCITRNDVWLHTYSWDIYAFTYESAPNNISDCLKIVYLLFVQVFIWEGIYAS